MPSFWRRTIRRSLAKAGITFNRVAVDIAREFGTELTDPVTYQYLSPLIVRPTVTVDLEHARAGVMAFRFAKDSPNPLLMAAKGASGAQSARQRRQLVAGVLEKYYHAVRPETALEVLGLLRSDAPGLASFQRDEWAFPWSSRGIAENAGLRQKIVLDEALGRRRFLTAKDGMTLFGPVTAAKLDFEADRVASLVSRIETIGWSPARWDLPEVVGLRSGGEFRWLVVQGQHRLAVCGAFAIRDVEANVVNVVRREDAELWPHVVGGTFSLSGALALFDRLYEGAPPPCAKQWNCSELPPTEA